MFCLPIVQFFKAIGDFRKTLRELKSSLHHLREILSSVLRITQDMEDLTSEVKNIVDFYSNESKSAVHGQFIDFLTNEGKDELFYRDFVRQYKHLVSQEISNFLSAHDNTKHSLIVSVEILQKLRYTINMMKSLLYNNEMKMKFLGNIDDDVYSMLQCLESDLLDMSTSEKTEQTNDKHLFGKSEEKLDIRLFCDKQKLLQSLQNTLTIHMGVRFETAAEDGFDTSFVIERPQQCQINTKELVYRERATRIRKLRQYLTTKIKLKKIGDYYREEISLQIQVDLKEASENLEKFEITLHEVTCTWVGILKHLPKHRFKEVLAEENLQNVTEKITGLFENNIMSKVEHTLNKVDVESMVEFTKEKAMAKGNEIWSQIDYQPEKVMDILNVIQLDSEPELHETIKEIIHKDFKLENWNGKNKHMESVYPEDVAQRDNVCTDSHRNEISELNGDRKTANDIVGDEKEIPENKIQSDHRVATTFDDVISTILYLDCNAIIDDVKRIGRPLIAFLVKRSSRWAIATVDRTLLTTSDVICTLASLVTSLNEDTDTKEADNVFLNTLIRLLPDICEADANKLIALCNVVKKRKGLKAKFLKDIENNVSGGLLTKGEFFLQETGEKCLSGCIENILRSSI